MAKAHDPGHALELRLLRNLLALVSGITLLMGFSLLINENSSWFLLGLVGLLLLAEGGLFWLLKSGRQSLVKQALVYGIAALGLFITVAMRGIHALGLSIYIVSILTGGLLLGRRPTVVLVFFGALLGGCFALLKVLGYLPGWLEFSPLQILFASVLIYIWIALTFRLTLQNQEEIQQRAVLEVRQRMLANEDLHQRVQELVVLQQVAAVCVQAQDETTLIEHFTRILGDTFFSDNFGVLLLEQMTGVLVHHSSYAIRADLQPVNVPVGQGIVGQVAASGQPKIVGDVSQDPNYRQVIPGTLSELCVPIKSGTQVLGVINVERAERNAFSLADQRLLVTLADQLATAIERVRLVTALQTSESRYHSLFESLPIGLFRVSPEGCLQEANPALLRLLGDPAQEYLDHLNLFDRFKDVDGHREWSHLIDLYGALERHDVQIQRFDQALIKAEANAVAVRDENGQILYYEGSLQDVTERVQTQKRLSYYARRLRLLRSVDQSILAAHSPDAIARAALRNIGELVPSQWASVALFDYSTRRVHTLAVNSVKTVKQDHQYVGDVNSIQGLKNLQRNRPHFVFDLRSIARPSPFERVLIEDGIRSIVNVPLMGESQLIGVLTLGADRPAALNRMHGEVARELADSLSTALQHARLFEQTQKRLEHLQALRSIDLAITSSESLQPILKVLIDQVIGQLGVDAATVLLIDEERERLEFAARQGFHTGALRKTRLKIGESYAGLAAQEGQVVHVPDLRVQMGELARSDSLADEGFVTYFAVPLLAKGRVLGVLEVFQRQLLQVEAEWREFLLALATQAAIAIDNVTLFTGLKKSNQELAQAYDSTLEGWSRALELRDRETEGHAQRVVALTLALARRMGIDEDNLVHMRRGALLHDIGKLGIPDGVLLKTGKLTDGEWTIMRQHPVFAYELLRQIPFLEDALDIPYYHHERWDGSGYPLGLRGEAIPLAARVFTVIDVWDALSHDRPYRPAWPKEQVYQYIESQAGVQFDPKVVRAFLALVKSNGHSH